MHPQDLEKIVALSAPSVHPDGRWAVLSATRPSLSADDYVGQLWRISLTGAPSQRLTRGFRDTDPQFSPDGRVIAFLRAEPGAAAQLAIIPADGGEPMVITDAELGVREFAFSPNSQRLAYVASVPAEGRFGTTDGVDSGHEDPRLIDRLRFHANGIGYLGDQRRQVFVLDVPDPRGEPWVRPVGRAARDAPGAVAVPPTQQWSSGDFDHHGLAWIKTSVIAIASRHPGADRDLRADLYRFDAEGAEPVRLTESALGPSVLASPVVVGDRVFFVGIQHGPSGIDVAGVNAGVCVVPTSGGVGHMVTDPEAVGIEGVLTAFGDAVLAIDQVRGNGQAVVATEHGERERISADGSLKCLAAAGPVRVGILTTPTSACEMVNLDDPNQALTDFHGDFPAAVVAPRPHQTRAADGYPVHGWTLTPTTPGPHPVVLMIHGGPFAAYHGNFFDEAQVLVGAGYAVLMCNPRGSAGYGQAHGRAVKGAMGEVDMADVLAFLDSCLDTFPELDRDRVGVMGGSYGGYLAAWLIGHSRRFAAAIVERGYLDGRSMIGASDIGWFFPTEYQGELTDIDQHSPLYCAHLVETPTLIIHSENDLRCPISVAQRYYTELKLRGVETQLLVFPGENHELSRSGTPHHRLARFDHILAWWKRHL